VKKQKQCQYDAGMQHNWRTAPIWGCRIADGSILTAVTPFACQGIAQACVKMPDK
jgi:hypothetical protein